MVPRRAARAVLLDDRDRVLLLWHSRPGDDEHWAPPGGGIESGELPEEALRRELAEEVGLTGAVLRGPVWLWQHHFSYHGLRIEQHEAIYTGHVGAWTPQGSAHHQAADGIGGFRWWSSAELLESEADIWPHGLGRALPELIRSGSRAGEPVDLGLTTRP